MVINASITLLTEEDEVPTEEQVAKAIKDLYEGFQERHKSVEGMFRDEKTSFVVVSAPNEASIEVADFFIDELQKRNMPNPGIVVNQCHITSEEDLDVLDTLKDITQAASSDLPANTDSMFLARLNSAYRRLRMLSQYEKGMIAELRKKKDNIWIVPRIHGEVHDIQALYRVGNYLCKGKNK